MKPSSTGETSPRAKGRSTPPKLIVCRLGEIMERKRVLGKELAEKAGLSVDTITKLKNQTWTKIDRQMLGRLCAVLDVGIDDLLQAVPADVWFPIRRHRRVTVHLGSASFALLRGDGSRSAAGQADEEAYIDRQFIGTWDVRAFFHAYEHLNRTTPGGVFFAFEEHKGWPTAEDPKVEQVFADGNHLILGSPVVNPLAEYAVCHGYGVDPLAPRTDARLRYAFRWQADRKTLSSFGAADLSATHELGIVDRTTGELVARRTVVAEGPGDDCGLLFSYRYRPRTLDDRVGDSEDFVVIAIMGHSGCSTLAGTMLACDQAVGAQALYPSQPNQPMLRAFRATYTRRGPALGYDNRRVGSVELVENTAAE